MKALALTSDTAVISCVGNDYGYKYIFSRQLEALGTKNDLLIMLSTSGKSQNILEVSKTGKMLGIKRILLTGKHLNTKVAEAELVVKVSSSNTARIQEMHIFMGHMACQCIDLLL